MSEPNEVFAAKNFWGWRGKLRTALREYNGQPTFSVEEVVAMISLFYTGLGHAASRWRLQLWNVIWPLRAVWCWWHMFCLVHDLSVIVSAKSTRELAEKLSANDLDVVASAMKCLLFYEEARLACLEAALEKEDLTPGSKALILVQLADLHFERDRCVQAKGEMAEAVLMAEARVIADEQRVRVYRAQARALIMYLDHPQASERAMNKALAIARDYGWGDQVTKIRATAKKLDLELAA